MDIERMCRMLPTVAPETVQDMIDCDVIYGDTRELGVPLCVYRRVSVEVSPEIKRTMDYNDWHEHDKQTKRHWGAECHCGACEEDFIAGYVNGRNAIRLHQGEDGVLYEGYCGADENKMSFLEIGSGDAFCCPKCDCYVEAVPASEIRKGRTYQLQLVSVENVDGYTVMMHWLAKSYYDEYGDNYGEIVPRDALVIDKNGSLKRFSHVKRSRFGEVQLDRWVYNKSYSDPILKAYYDYGSICHKKKGAYIVRTVPDMTGCTGEKTGLAEFIEYGGEEPNLYLRCWNKWKSIENLMKCGWHELIVSVINDAYGKALDYNYTVGVDFEAQGVLNLKKRKPHEILGITKAECRAAAKVNLQMPYRSFKAFKEFQRVVPISFSAYLDYYEAFLERGMTVIRDMIEHGNEDWRNLDKLKRYLEKSAPDMALYRAAELYSDYRNMLTEDELTAEKLYPKDLQKAHDAKAQIAAMRQSTQATEGFREIIDKYGDLEYTDGKLCILLPRSAAAIEMEGKTLRHCVGSYIDKHLSEKCIVFFVRKAHRRERSYYTLDISVRDGVPQINQLHGYGNERHGDCKQYSHTIPQKIKAFVANWEKQVLIPFFLQKQQAKIKKIKEIA